MHLPEFRLALSKGDGELLLVPRPSALLNDEAVTVVWCRSMPSISTRRKSMNACHAAVTPAARHRYRCHNVGAGGLSQHGARMEHYGRDRS